MFPFLMKEMGTKKSDSTNKPSEENHAQSDMPENLAEDIRAQLNKPKSISEDSHHAQAPWQKLNNKPVVNSRTAASSTRGNRILAIPPKTADNKYAPASTPKRLSEDTLTQSSMNQISTKNNYLKAAWESKIDEFTSYLKQEKVKFERFTSDNKDVITLYPNIKWKDEFGDVINKYAFGAVSCVFDNEGFCIQKKFIRAKNVSPDTQDKQDARLGNIRIKQYKTIYRKEDREVDIVYRIPYYFEELPLSMLIESCRRFILVVSQAGETLRKLEKLSYGGEYCAR